MTTQIHVRFTRPCDASDAFPAISDHVAGARLGEEGIEVECEAIAETAVMRELEHALDGWLVERQLPFTPDDVGEHTLLVHPPGD